MDTLAPNPAIPPLLWQEARNSEGRVYYYNVQTKSTQWAKPPELMTPSERALANQPWKEYTAESGRKYWYNTETKQSSWELPEAYKNALAQAQETLRPPVAPSFVAGGTAASNLPLRDYERNTGGERRGLHTAGDANGIVIDSQMAEPDYPAFEDAEAAFIKLLRRHGVQSSWTWEQTMRAVIRDPQYRALKDPRDRRNAFEKYVAETITQEKDRAKERLGKLRSDFGTMLRRHPEITACSRWKTILPIIQGETIFRSTSDENERRQFFEEYTLELKKEQEQRELKMQKEAKENLAGILRNLNLDPYTRWSEAQELIHSTGQLQSEFKARVLTQSDTLAAFENHIKTLERRFNDTKQQQKASKARRERQNRDNFMAFLQELKRQGQLKAGSKWMDIFPLIQDDNRYKSMLGQAGSTPLDLFRDIVEEEERSLRLRRNEVFDVLDDRRYELTLKSTFDEFESVMKTDRRTERIDRDVLQLIFSRLQEKIVRRAEDEKHTANRHQRRAVDALRSKIKHLDPPIRVTDTWDHVRPRVERSEEYRALDSDELRVSAFEKVIRRLKEKEEDTEKDRDRREHHDRHDRSDRGERSYRNNQSSYRGDGKGNSSRPSRTPEPDAYEADRRKAQADRERSYRKASGLSQSPMAHRERDRDRERGKDRDRCRDRDRRDWDDDREKLHTSRADPRSGRDELDYGVGESMRSTPGQKLSERRRRRDSETESVGSRSAKRYRRDGRDSDRGAEHSRREKEREKPAAEQRGDMDTDVVNIDNPAIHSGSEEGEIEED